jgi:DNA-binding transcriptional MerR regulator
MVAIVTDMEGFPTPVAAKLSGVTPQTLKSWAHRGFLRPSFSGGPRRPSIYSFRDVLALRVAGNLCAQGIEVHRLKRVVEYLRKRKGLELTASDVLASTLLVSDGRDVYEVNGIDAVSGISTLRNPDQTVMLVQLGRLVAQLQADVRKLQSRAA